MKKGIFVDFFLVYLWSMMFPLWFDHSLEFQRNQKMKKRIVNTIRQFVIICIFFCISFIGRIFGNDQNRHKSPYCNHIYRAFGLGTIQISREKNHCFAHNPMQAQFGKTVCIKKVRRNLNEHKKPKFSNINLWHTKSDIISAWCWYNARRWRGMRCDETSGRSPSFISIALFTDIISDSNRLKSVTGSLFSFFCTSLCFFSSLNMCWQCVLIFANSSLCKITEFFSFGLDR